MANLSDLMVDASQHRVPGWIAALEPGAGFRDHAYAPGPQADTVLALESEPQTALDQAAALAYARGHADALASAAALHEREGEAAAGLALAFARLDAAARGALSERLAQAVAALCEQIIEPALIDPAALAQRCDILAEAIGEVAGPMTLHLNPDDMPLLPASTTRDWTIRPDPALPRGGLRLEHADGAVADGPEEWRRLIAGALGA